MIKLANVVTLDDVNKETPGVIIFQFKLENYKLDNKKKITTFVNKIIHIFDLIILQLFLKMILGLDPLEQFQNLSLNNYDNKCHKSIGFVSWFYIWSILLITSIWSFIYKKAKFTLVFSLSSKINDLVQTMLIDNIKTLKNVSYYNFLFIFWLIFVLNLNGLVPYSWTITSWITFIFYIALTYFFYININLLLNKTWYIFEFFLPNGTPLVITPFLIIIEIISYLSKIMSISVRLFANMLSGHALLKILISFLWKVIQKLNILFIITITIWFAITGIFVLECLVAILQAYVFCLLLIIYWTDAWTKSH